MSDLVLAGDLGGTNLRVAAVDRSGRLVHRAEAETPRHTDDSLVVAATADLAKSIISEIGAKPQAFAFVIPAIMSAEEEKIFKSPNLPELNGSSLARQIESKLGIPVILENDANAAALGEFWLGASRGCDNSICITLGTGVGGGVILDGKLRSGPDGTAGEIGHICVDRNGPPCGCGSNGCLEQYSSASAIVRSARELRRSHPETRLPADGPITSRDVFELGTKGDALCVEVFRRAGESLGTVLAGLINVLNPEAIVIGGGAAEGWDLLIGGVRSEIRKRAFREPAERARIVRALLGGDAGIVGAAYLALSRSGAKASRPAL